MEQMQQLFGNPEKLSVREMFSKYKLCQNVPYWKDNPSAQQWMKVQNPPRYLMSVRNGPVCNISHHRRGEDAPRLNGTSP